MYVPNNPTQVRASEDKDNQVIKESEMKRKKGRKEKEKKKKKSTSYHRQGQKVGGYIISENLSPLLIAPWSVG